MAQGRVGQCRSASESGLSILSNFNGDEESRQARLRQFSQFVREHEASIFTFVFRYVGNREDAEDITQEALLQAYRTWLQINPDVAGGYIKWCYRIARNLSIDSLRKKKPRGVDEDEMKHAVDAKSLRPEEVYEHRVQSRQIKECIQELDETYREVLVLKYQEDMSYEQIAEILDLPISTIETRIFRAKKVLRDKLGGE